MNILFLTMNNFSSIDEHSIYPDLIRYIASKGHNITVLIPNEKKNNQKTFVEMQGNIRLIRVKTGNLFNVGMITKLISRFGIAPKYISTIKKYVKGETIDLVLYSTPPTTFHRVVSFVKKSFRATSYLMLKDIFPQNAVDLGMISQNGLAYKFLRIGEKKLYKISDFIGCMSPANVDYLLKQDTWIDENKVEVCPNALEVKKKECIDRIYIREKYGIPRHKTVFVYGGGLGKAQGIDFLMKCIKASSNDSNIYFLICGDGPYLEPLQALEKANSDIMKVVKWIPVDEYNKLVRCSDVGLIFLDNRFKIPNYPSRLLLYIEAGLPVLAATDSNSDVGKIALENNYGDWCESNMDNVEVFVEKMVELCNPSYREELGKNARDFFLNEYSVNKAYTTIFDHFLNNK